MSKRAALSTRSRTGHFAVSGFGRKQTFDFVDFKVTEWPLLGKADIQCKTKFSNRE